MIIYYANDASLFPNYWGIIRYHSLHHSEQNSNFCLFMPLYDYLHGTVDPKTDAFYALVRQGKLLALMDKLK